MSSAKPRYMTRLSIETESGWRRQVGLNPGERRVFGRHPYADVLVRDGMISRTHFQIEQGEDKLLVRDLTSQNGTFVNQRRIWSTHELQDGDVIEAGNTKCTVSTGDSPQDVEDTPDEFQRLFCRINQNNPDEWIVLLDWCKRRQLMWEFEFCKEQFEKISAKIGKRKRSDKSATMVAMPKSDLEIPRDIDKELEERAERLQKFEKLLEMHGLTMCDECRAICQTEYHEGKCWGTGVDLSKVVIPPDESLEAVTDSVDQNEREDFALLTKLCMVAPVIGAESIFVLPKHLRRHILEVRFLNDFAKRYANQYLQEREVVRSDDCVQEVVNIIATGDESDTKKLDEMIARAKEMDAEQYRDLPKSVRREIDNSHILRAVIFPDDPEMSQIDDLSRITLPDDPDLERVRNSLPQESRSELNQLARLTLISTLLRPNAVFRFSQEVRSKILEVPLLKQYMERLAVKVLRRLGLTQSGDQCVNEIVGMIANGSKRDFARLCAMVEKVASLDPKQLDGLTRRDLDTIEKSVVLRTAVLRVAKISMLAPGTGGEAQNKKEDVDIHSH